MLIAALVYFIFGFFLFTPITNSIVIRFFIIIIVIANKHKLLLNEWFYNTRIILSN